MGDGLSHLGSNGNVRMVDVSDKPDTVRTAVARGAVVLAQDTLSMIQKGEIPKGNVYTTARIAGIMAAKKVGELIPLCHPLCLTNVSIDFDSCSAGGRARIGIEARARLVGKTGVEMEVLTAVAVAALTIYDMCKAVDGGISITDIHLVEKSGGTKPKNRESTDPTEGTGKTG